ncbi:hypothetical protein CERSUDRAFT_74244 [Gelatoporia subvermispora B]|uniref:Uncharacterized protein n=1 Tax=Ceriporiopsis subvermispora (strain B) TaxID=914234 RepID=M2RBP0_CERS8|nr:hypothetical protein CERSUDRAFT_74244 [Gelatoporia subvermispora B]
MSATGSIKAEGANKFIGSFTVSGVKVNITGNLSDSIQTWSCSDATLDYGSTGHLTSTRDFHGVIGTTTISLQFTNGPSITGNLDSSLTLATTVVGSGTWESD